MSESQIVSVSESAASKYQGTSATFRYTRASFYLAGLDDYTQAPSQSSDMFEQLTNVMPVTTGRLTRRMGYSSFASSLGFVPTRIYSYRGNPISGGSVRNRYIYTANSHATVATNESGTITHTGIFTPGGSASHPRAVVSRDYIYFVDGVAADTKKWSGTDTAATNGTTLQGIVKPSTSLTATLSTLASGEISTVAGSAVVTKVSGSAFATDTSWDGLWMSIGHIPYQIADYDAGLGDSATSRRLTSAFGGTYTNLDYFVPTAGNISVGITGSGRRYYTAFYSDPDTTLADGTNKGTGHYSDLSPIAAPDISLGFYFGKYVFAHASYPTTSDPQVTHFVILATSVSGDPSTLYLVKTDEKPTGFIPIAYSSDVTDNVVDDVLTVSSIYFETDAFGREIGLTDNTPLGTTNGTTTLICTHKGRLYTTSGPSLYFTKSISDVITSTSTLCGRWEECWPAYNTVAISTQDGSEIINALVSDGQNLYIGTQHSVYRLIGDPVINGTVPELLFNNVGVACQEVWKLVYLEGAPVGMMWLTPDLRVVMSDMNTYDDVGIQVQTTLNAISPTYISSAWGVYYGHGPYDFYMLGLPDDASGCSKALIFSLRTKKWYYWRFKNTTEQLAAALYDVFVDGTVKILYTSGTTSGTVYKSDESVITDGGTGVSVLINTSWLDLGDPTTRKYLNEIEIQTEDTAFAVTVQGANTLADFSSPTTVITAAVPAANELGDLKIPLAGKSTKYRWYRLSMITASGSSATNILSYLAIEAVPITRF